MNLNYEKIRAKVEHGGNQWTSYSDLFLVLSVVFLLLYVVSNLRSGTTSFASATAIKAAKAEAEDLKKQIKAYEVLREDYLKQGASKDEIQVYQELMGKLSLLEDQSKNERKDLYKKAQAAADKEQELNRYQQMVKNIISANLVAQSRVKKREDIIVERQGVITQREKDIEDLGKTVSEKESLLQANNNKISEIENQLEKKIKEVQWAYKSKKKSEKSMKEQIAKLREDSYAEIGRLKEDNTKVASVLEATQGELAEKSRQAERLMTQLSEKEMQAASAKDELKRAHEEALAREKQAFERGMNKAALTAEAKLKKEQEYRAAIEKQNEAYNAKVAALNTDLESTRKSIKDIEGKYQNSLNSLQSTNDSLKKSLTASETKLNEQKVLAQRIKKNFEKSGIHAEIDPKTGDVMIQFQNEYFDTGRADLKNGMRSTLERLMPVYAKSLMQDKKVASRIGSVEIVGFASPTYKGKYVNPDSLAPENRTAVNFNMDLSYQRAKSIFEYVFDSNKMSFEHQKTLLPLIKVSGRSYLATEKQEGRNVSSTKEGNFCQMYDCKKSQRVIIKFNLRDE